MSEETRQVAEAVLDRLDASVEDIAALNEHTRSEVANSHADLLVALKAAPVIYIDEPTGHIMPGFGKEYRIWLGLARTAIEDAEKGKKTS